MTATINPYASPETADLVQQEQDVPPVEPKIFAFSGRLGRMRMVTYMFLASLLSMAIAMPMMALLFGGNVVLGGLIYVAVLLFSTIYSISLYRRRLHDLDKSGWWMLLFLVPLVNIGLLLYLCFAAGTAGANQYGAPTTPNSAGLKVGFVVSLLFTVALPILAAISIPAYQDYVQRAQQAQMQ